MNPDAPMKDSGLKWLDKIPSHWTTERSQWVFSQRREKAKSDDEQLTASQKYGVISQKKFMEIEGRRVTQVEFNAEILKHVESGDFVISMRSFQGGIEYCPHVGCVSSAYVPLIPTEKVHAPYFKYLLKSPRYIEALQSTSNLVRDGQALRFENFRMIDLPVVPIEEQKEIANFVAKQIDANERSINIQAQQIEKLKEYKTTLINSAVTGKIKVPNVV
ncbi:type I restriction-modification system [Vibrio sp. JCM 19236]|nr:type I restriction-modification system [Vibrio sp. JCM 19236]